jgi:hypothetical protein
MFSDKHAFVQSQEIPCPHPLQVAVLYISIVNLEVSVLLPSFVSAGALLHSGQYNIVDFTSP